MFGYFKLVTAAGRQADDSATLIITKTNIRGSDHEGTCQDGDGS